MSALWRVGLAWLLAAGVARAAVGAGENLLINGTFEAEQSEFPEFWTPSSSKAVRFLRTGGPGGGTGAVALKDGGPLAGTLSVRQQGLTLVPGGTYTLSVHVRTKGFKSRHAGVIVHNSGWINEAGMKAFPADSEWTRYEKTFTLFASKGNEYGVALFAAAPEGEIAFADVRLEAVSDDARAGSSSQLALVNAPRLVPMQPLLNRIPAARPELTFRFFGALPEKEEAYVCEVSVAGTPLARQASPLRAGRVTVPLAGLACGDYVLEAAVRHKATGAAAVEARYGVSVVDPPAVDGSRVRRLNNLVAEVLDGALAAEAGEQAFGFVNPRDGWVFVSVEPTGEATGLAVAVDGVGLVMTARAGRQEAFRELGQGERRITVSGAAGGGRVVVRSVAEIFNYPPCVNPQVKENGAYDWAFMKRHVLHAVTTLNGGTLPGEAQAEAKALGLRWLANCGVTSVAGAERMREHLERSAGLTQPQYDGLTSDELFFARANIDEYTRALWALRNPEQRLIYTWVVGKPGIPALHTDFMSACLNASKGRGRLLFEAYCHPQPDEAAAAAYLDNMAGETMRRFRATFPGAEAGTGMIFGNFNQIPILSLEHDPAVDFKYFLDMQVNLIANSPDFEGLATTGYWGTYYGDEELARWSFLLMRHYAVEGRREMLSARHGFRYNPGFVANGDFAEGLAGWDVSAAEAGSVRADKVTGYGKNSQGRWGAGAAGDTVCVMVRREAAANRVSQTVRGLEPGRAYCLQFVTADHGDVTGKRHNPRRYGIDVALEGVERLPDRSFVHVDRRKDGRYKHNDNVAKVNLHRIVFRAAASELTLAFHDTAAAPGEALMLNYVQLKPYLE